MTTHRPANARNPSDATTSPEVHCSRCAPARPRRKTPSSPQQPFQISLGSFTNASEITIRADGENQEGTEIRLGRHDRRRRRHDLPARQLLAHQRPASRALHVHRKLAASGPRFSIATSNGMENPFPSTRRSRSEFGFYVVEVAYEYDFSKREDRELVLSAGLHYTTSPPSSPAPATLRRRRRHHDGRQRERRSARHCR